MPIEGFEAALERLGPCGAKPRLAVAVSGGADSTALVLLARDFCAQRGGEVMAYIVDHGLREGAADEAGLTVRRLAARGIASRILVLCGLPRGAGLQAAARAARYQALGEAARADGFLHLLLGHHAADQEETVAMRALRGPGGAEGMPAWSARHDILLLRPLLGVRPELLRAYLRVQDMEWVEDPSNQSPRFERVRVREAKAGTAPSGGAARAARDAAAADYLAGHAQIYPEGYALLDAATAPPAALGALLRVIGGGKYPPRQDALARLGAKLRPATLGGVRLLKAGRFGPGWLVVREPAACAPDVAATPGAQWDNRFTWLGGAAAGHTLGALGAAARNYPDYGNLPSIVRLTLPCLRGPGGEMTFPAAVRFTPFAPATSHPFVTTLAKELC